MVLAKHVGLVHAVRPGSASSPIPCSPIAVVDDVKPVARGTQGVLAVHVPESPLFLFDGYRCVEDVRFLGN